MIFYILIGIGVALIIAASIYFHVVYDDEELTAAGGFVTFVICAVLLGFFAMVSSTAGINPTNQHTRTHSLTALSNTTQQRGEYVRGIFAGYGYDEGIRVLYYVEKDRQGGIHLLEADADQSVIYQTATTDTSHVEVTNYSWHKSWLVPWGINAFDPTYKFYVPKGTVSTDFGVDNSK